MNPLKDKVAIVTGSTRGIGRAIAEALLRDGCKVVISSRSGDDAVQVAEALAPGGAVLGVACDVSRSDQVRDLLAAAERKFGGVDILINNAGVGGFEAVETMSDETWERVLATNLTGVFYCCRAVVPAMRRRGGGTIVNIGSLAGKQAFPKAAAYCASKFGLLGFSEAFMQEVRYDHIRVSCVMPGSVDTEFGGGQHQPQPWKLSPEDVADVVMGLLRQSPRALASRVELRPSEPARK